MVTKNQPLYPGWRQKLTWLENQTDTIFATREFLHVVPTNGYNVMYVSLLNLRRFTKPGWSIISNEFELT